MYGHLFHFGAKDRKKKEDGSLMVADRKKGKWRRESENLKM